ncbi:OmpH family outer membrane protein [Acidicapsa ligni]|uniref:OmpH family outer membrane protein n=1 Tax=Acidicapsa ligni TaxID=542300 RepID=UPI0021DFB968|nr:OmpH family outer membrane protein [Acidicapsa ligni]
MKRTLALALLASGFVPTALNAAAQTPAAPAAVTVSAIPAKVAVLAFQVAVAQTNEGQRNFADLQKKFEPKRAQLKAQNDEIEGLKKALQAQGDKLTPAESSSRAKTIDEKTKQLQRAAEDAQNDFQQEIQDMYNTLASKVYEVVSSYAQEQGFTLVVDVSQQQSPVLWAAESTNITQPIILAYNTKSGVPAPPAQPNAPEAGQAPRPAATRKAPAAAPKN